jgi:hypothetical protein
MVDAQPGIAGEGIPEILPERIDLTQDRKSDKESRAAFDEGGSSRTMRSQEQRRQRRSPVTRSSSQPTIGCDTAADHAF